jgi:hypothetical protein
VQQSRTIVGLVVELKDPLFGKGWYTLQSTGVDIKMLLPRFMVLRDANAFNDIPVIVRKHATRVSVAIDMKKATLFNIGTEVDVVISDVEAPTSAMPSAPEAVVDGSNPTAEVSTTVPDQEDSQNEK